jgi:cell division protein FtsW
MLIMGLVMILSASSIDAFDRGGSPFVFFNRQLLGTALGMISLIVMARMDYRKLRVFARVGLVGTILLLIAVLIPGVGEIRGGSARWIALGSFTFQPSEMAKLTMIIFSAFALEKKAGKLQEWGDLAVPLVPMGGLALLIMLQPDLGSTLILCGAIVVMVYLAGVKAQHLFVITSLGVVATIVLILTEGYRKARLFSFLDPWADPLNTGYQTIQSQIALGSGGWFGVGLGASRQKWSYIPNAHTDFIYAIIGEELGLAGTLLILVAFAVLIYLGIRIAKNAPDTFGMLLAGGITGWLGLQTVINMGAVTGLLPITGVPLPLISYGGSSLVFTMAGIGILISVARRSRV